MQTDTLYISDMDGTLLGPQAVLSAHTKHALQAMLAQGMQFTVATARTFGSAGKILEDIPLSLPVILMNGVLIYDPVKRHYLKRCVLAPETVAALTHGLKQAGITGLMYALRGDEMLTYYEALEGDFITEYVESRKTAEPTRVFLEQPFDNVQAEEIIYFTLHGDYAQVAPALALIENISGLSHTCYPDIYSENQWYLEIFSGEASKKSGALFLKETLCAQRLVGFGDNLNDLPLLEACDLGIAVANADEQVKAAADILCGANHQDGVVKWIAADMGAQD